MFKTKKTSSESSPLERACSSSDVARIAGVSLRQLQWWDEQKVVSPRHEGHRRVYSPEEVVEITVIAELRRKGFSLQKIRRVLRYLQREMGKHLGSVMAGTAEMHLLTDGKNIFLEDSQARVIEVLKSAKQAMFLVCVSDQARRLTSVQRKPAKAETQLGAARRTRAAV
jgi:DNA-binding transcriptional MerR regulator